MWVIAGVAALVAVVRRTIRRGGSLRTVVPVVLLSAFGVALTQTVVVAVLPVLGDDLGVSAATATWLLTGFMLASAVATPICGRLGDLYGYPTLLSAGLTCLVAGSVFAAVAEQAGWFPGVFIGRILQGCAGGVFPVAFGLARECVPKERLNGVVAALSALFGVGGAAGMVVGPLVASAFGTASLFWMTGAIAVVALAGASVLPRGSGRSVAEPLDVGGAVVLAGALVGLLLVISRGAVWGWPSFPTLSVAGATVLSVVCFVLIELRSAAPLLDVRLLATRALAPTNTATLLIGIGMFAAVTLIPRFVQSPTENGYGFGADALGVVRLMTPIAVGMLIGVPLASWISGRTSHRSTFVLGSLAAVLCLAMLAFAHDSPWQIDTAGAIMGIAYGLAFASLGGLVIAAVRPAHTGAATGVNTVLRTVGGAIGAQVAAVVVSGSAVQSVPRESGYTTAFLAAAAIVALAAVCGLAIPPSGHRLAQVREIGG